MRPDVAEEALQFLTAGAHRRGRTLVSVAVARAASGARGKALEAMRAAASYGFGDVARMDREPLLASIRGDRKYASVMQAMSAKASPTK